MKQEKFAELQNLITPVFQFINDNFDPHAIVIIQNDRFDVYRGECGAGIGYWRIEKES